MRQSLLDILRCPLTGSELRKKGESLISNEGQVYPIVNDVPVLLIQREDPTLWVSNKSLKSAKINTKDKWHLDTLGITPEQLVMLRTRITEFDTGIDSDSIDPVVSFLVGATCGNLYTNKIGKLNKLPTVEFPAVARTSDRILLDVGCGWGRWSFAAVRKGYSVVSVDPSLGAVMAAKRTAENLGLNIEFVVADAVNLPFTKSCFDDIFSYSVLQHFSKIHFVHSLKEFKRCSKNDAKLYLQLPNKIGLRCLYHQFRRGFRAAEGFEVRYYSPWQLKKYINEYYGENTLSVDGFFGLSVQTEDLIIMSFFERIVIRFSAVLTSASLKFKPLIFVADSLFVKATVSKIDMED